MLISSCRSTHRNRNATAASRQHKLGRLLLAQLEYAVREQQDPSLATLKTVLQESTVKEMRRRELENIESGSDLFGKQSIAYVKGRRSGGWGGNRHGPLRKATGRARCGGHDARSNYRDAASVRAKEFVRDQRLGLLTQGAWFAQYTAKGRTPSAYRFYKASKPAVEWAWMRPDRPLTERWRAHRGREITNKHATQLSPNKKILHYCDATDKRQATVAIEHLPQRSMCLALFPCTGP